MEWGIIGTAIYVILMIIYVRFALRKSERDWEYMQESNRRHAEWMVNFGRAMERNEGVRND